MMNTKEKLVSEIIALVKQLADAPDDSIQSDSQTVEMLTIKDCPKVIRGLSEHTVRQLIAQGKLPSVRTGQGRHGKILVNKADLLAYFQHDA